MKIFYDFKDKYQPVYMDTDSSLMAIKNLIKPVLRKEFKKDEKDEDNWFPRTVNARKKKRK